MKKVRVLMLMITRCCARLRDTVNNEDGMIVVGEAANGTEALEKYRGET